MNHDEYAKGSNGELDIMQEQTGNVSRETEILKKNEVWYTHAMEYLTVIEMGKPLIYHNMEILKIIMLRERRQTKIRSI